MSALVLAVVVLLVIAAVVGVKLLVVGLVVRCHRDRGSALGE